MPAAVTSDALLTRIKARAQIPSTEGRLSDAEIFTIVDDLILSSVGREVYDADDGRWVRTAADVSLTSGTGAYRLPTRAMAGGVDEVIVIQGTELYQLDYVDRSDVWEWGTATGMPRAFTIMGDVITLLPTPASGYSLRVRYLRRPSKLVAVQECAIPTVVGSTTLTASLISAVAAGGWTSPTVIDLHQSIHHGEALEDDIAVSFSGSTITRTSGTFTTTGAYAVTAADAPYAALAGKSCVVQVPDVAIPYIADLAARDVCVALGDMEGADRSASLAEQRRKEMMSVISERSRQRPKVVPRNSPLRVASQRSSRWWPR